MAWLLTTLCFIVKIGVILGRPNILFILADDYGWNDIGYHGSEIKTPTLDKLAASGVKLDNYYVQPICTPSRSQLMSGRYQIHTGLQHFVLIGPQPGGLPLGLPTLPDLLRQQGYATHLVGKWHLGFYKEDYMPTRRGFDSAYGYLTGMEDYYSHVRCVMYNDTGRQENSCGTDFRHNMDLVTDRKGQYSANVFTERAEAIIKDHAIFKRDKPLFMYLALQNVHVPLEVPERYVKPYEHIKNKNRRLYAGMVSAMDEAVANVTRAFRQYGLWDNTLLVFSTDNGGPMGSANNWPLRGGKNMLWEGGVRGVGFVTGPVVKATGVVNKELIHISDWLPTLVHLAGGNTSCLALDGYDQWQTITEDKASPRTELLHNIDPLYGRLGQRWDNSSFDNRVRAALRVGDWKILTGFVGDGGWIPPPPDVEDIYPPWTEDHEEAFVASKTKDDLDPAKQNVRLYNVHTDPREKHDLSAVYPYKVLEMLARLAEYNATAVPCHFPPYDPKSKPTLHGNAWGPWE